MGEAFDRMKEGLDEARAIARGDQPAARIWHQGIAYVPESELQEALRRYDERNQVAIERAGYAARCAELESELAGCKIALEQAWESNRERQAEIERLKQIVAYESGDPEALKYHKALFAKLDGMKAENERLLRNAQTDAWLLQGYHRICERHGIAPSSAELMETAKEAEDGGSFRKGRAQ